MPNPGANYPHRRCKQKAWPEYCAATLFILHAPVRKFD